MFFTIEKFEKRVEELEHRRYFGMRSIAPFAAMPGDLPEDSHYHGAPPEQDSREWKEFGLNDFFVGRDRYLWLDKELTLPPAMEGCRVAGRFDFGETGGGNTNGFESLLYVDGHLFLFPEYRKHYRSQRDSFWMSYDPNLPVVTDEMTGRRCFQLYLRSTTWRIDYTDTVFTSSEITTQAFHIEEFVEKAKASGLITGDSLNFQLVYPEYFLSEDSSSYYWRTSDIYTIDLDKDWNTW